MTRPGDLLACSPDSRRPGGASSEGDRVQKAELLASLKLKLLWPFQFGFWLCQLGLPFMPIVLIGVAIAIRSECAFRYVGLPSFKRAGTNQLAFWYA
jgi:hypothetical protein